MNLKRMLATSSVALMCMAAMAQDTGGGQGGAPDGGGPGGGRRGNFDPAQFQQQIMDRIREQMDVKGDDEWKVIGERVQKVMDARREAMPPFGRGLMGRRGGNDNGGARRGGMFGQTSPELEALQKAIESNAPADQIKDAMTKYRAARKVKQEALEKAQAELQKVLSVKQEAVAVSNGLLN